MFEDATEVDAGFYARHWGLRRARHRDSLIRSGPTTLVETLNTKYPQSEQAVYNSSAKWTLSGSAQQTVDQNNSSLMTLKKNLRNAGAGVTVDTGGPFYSEHVYTSAPQYVKHTWNSSATTGSTAVLDGYVHTYGSMSNNAWQIANGTFPRYLNSMSDATLKGWGSTGISRTLPTKPEMDLSTSLAELKDGLPSIIGAQLKRGLNPANAGSEFLNYQFGIAPLLSDGANILALTKHYEAILTQFRRDNGRMVRRRVTLVDERDEAVDYLRNQYFYAGGGDTPTISVGYADQARRSAVTSQKVWFSGAYKLAYPLELDDALRGITEFNRVYGVIPTPDLAWNLLPYSWLADWFSNVGDVIRNASTLGSSLQLAYGYVMCEDSWSEEVSGDLGPGYYWTRGDQSRVPVSSKVTHARKRRLKATPFGFSVRFEELSALQKAILTALGLSRLRL